MEAFFQGFVDAIVTFEPVRRFVRSETPLAFRLLTTRGGLVQSTVARRIAEILEGEAARGSLVLRAPAPDLAYAMTRIIEGFIYNDAMAEIDTDVETAVRIVCLLVRRSSEPRGVRAVDPVLVMGRSPAGHHVDEESHGSYLLGVVRFAVSCNGRSLDPRERLDHPPAV